MLSLLLVASCAAREPITVTSCPPPPWPETSVIDHMQEQKGTATGVWFKNTIKHFAECDELNAEAD